eukprot:153605-Rhodomonas_salina.1
MQNDPQTPLSCALLRKTRGKKRAETHGSGAFLDAVRWTLAAALAHLSACPSCIASDDLAARSVPSRSAPVKST